MKANEQLTAIFRNFGFAEVQFLDSTNNKNENTTLQNFQHTKLASNLQLLFDINQHQCIVLDTKILFSVLFAYE